MREDPSYSKNLQQQRAIDVKRPVQVTPTTQRSYWNDINSEDDETLDETGRRSLI